MTEEKLGGTLSAFREWFDSFCGSFRDADPASQLNYDLKRVHTEKVCEAARLIAGEGNERRRLLAEIAALFHDVGRFPQYQRYRTFKDSDSVNHAHLSVQVITEHGLLKRLPEAERERILCAVRLHNVYRLPDGMAPGDLDLVRIVRDADKVDIWRVFIEHYHAPAEEQASAATLGLPEDPACSPEVLATLISGTMVQLQQLKTVNDFKLLQLSWLYDINFPTTLALIKERSLIEGISDTLPHEGRVPEAVAHVHAYLERRLAQSRTL